jgi:hypothetical protein
MGVLQRVCETAAADQDEPSDGLNLVAMSFSMRYQTVIATTREVN